MRFGSEMSVSRSNVIIKGTSRLIFNSQDLGPGPIDHRRAIRLAPSHCCELAALQLISDFGKADLAWPDQVAGRIAEKLLADGVAAGSGSQ